MSLVEICVIPAGRISGMVPDYTKYHLAGAMLSYIRHTESFNEGMYFVDESIDCDQYRDVFHLIFVVMD